MRILLIWPPLAPAGQPTLSLPVLAGFLMKNGYTNVVQQDVNIEVLHTFLTESRVGKALENVEKVLTEFDLLNDKIRNPEEYAKLMELAKVATNCRDVPSNIDESKKIFRENLSNITYEKYHRAYYYLKSGLQLISAEYYPSKLGFDYFVMKASGQNSQGILRATKDEHRNPFLKVFREKILPKILNKKPNIVGISITYTQQIIPSFTLARLIKQADACIYIAIGGAVFSMLEDRIANNKDLFNYVDGFIFGEGEIPIVELADCLKTDLELSKVPNIAYLDNGIVKVNKKASIENLDEIPTPYFGKLPFAKYFSNLRILPLQITRDCYWNKCRFCNLVRHNDKQVYRVKDISLIVEDIRKLVKQYKTRNFVFVDNVIRPDLLHKLSVEIIKAGLDIRWFCQVRFESDFNRPLLRCLYLSGCRILFFGLESGDQRILNLMNKGINLQVVKKVIKNCFEENIHPLCSWFINFPSEGKEDAYRSARFILDLKEYLSLGIQKPNLFILSKNSEVYRKADNFGIIIDLPPYSNDLRLNYEYSSKVGMSRDGLTRVKNNIHNLLERHGLGYSQDWISYKMMTALSDE